MNQSKLKYKNLIIIGLIIFISIGFAYLTSSLQIFGTGHLKKTTWNIFFDNVQILQGNNLVENRPTTSADHTTTTLDYSVNFETPGDVFQFDVDIVNESTLDAMITVLNQSTNNDTDQDFFTYSIKYVDGSSLNKNELLKKKSFETIRVTVTYRKDINVEDLLEQEETVNFSLQLEYQQAKDAIERENKMIVEDLSGNGNYAKVYGAALNEDGTITLDGIDDYIDCGFAGKDFGSALSFVIRFKVENFNGTYNYIFNNHENAGAGMYITSADGVIHSLYKVAGVWYRVEGDNDNVIQKGQWYTLVTTYDGHNSYVYLNGNKLNASAQMEGNITMSSIPITIGVNYQRGGSHTGFSNITLSDALIFNRGLTEEEVNENYSNDVTLSNNTQLLQYLKFKK